MKIYAYNLNRHIKDDLVYNIHNLELVRSLQSVNKDITVEDVVICMWYDNESLEVVKDRENVFPSHNILNLSQSRINMTKILDKHSMFPAERFYIEDNILESVMVPRLESSLKVVAKVGDDHKGQNKYLLYPNQTITTKESIIFEEFIEDARSIRVLLIGDKAFVIEFHNDKDLLKDKSTEWIKNINCTTELINDTSAYKDLIRDTRQLSNVLDYDFLAIDYVVNKEKTVALEINPFPGITTYSDIHEVAYDYWFEKITSLSSNT